jgi:hypothetical protein
MTDQTDRLAMPLLFAGQAQKEITHNEALTLLDMLVQPVALSTTLAITPAQPEPGQCWIVPSGASGAWADRAGELALWTAGGWRFVAPKAGW